MNWKDYDKNDNVTFFLVIAGGILFAIILTGFTIGFGLIPAPF